MSKDSNERKHRRTWRHPECVALMANANFDAAPSLAEAMGLTDDEEALDEAMIRMHADAEAAAYRRLEALQAEADLAAPPVHEVWHDQLPF